MNPKYKTKVLILITSLIVTCTFTEIALRFVIKNTNEPELYAELKELELNINEESNKTKYFRDSSIEIFQTKSNHEILSFGDSFTNGGNVTWDKSYPYQTYLELGKQVTVRNLGVCSNTTTQVLNRIKQFLASEKYDSNKKYTLPILIGAADDFAINFERPIVGVEMKKLNWFNMNNLISIEEIKKTLNKSYLIRIFIFTVKELYERVSGSIFSYSSYANYITEFNSCLENSDDIKRRECFSNTIEKFKHADYKVNDVHNFLAIKLIGKKNSFKSMETARIIGDFLYFIDKYPENLYRDDFIVNIYALAKFQNVISVAEITSSIRKSMSKVDLPAELTKVLNTLLAHTASWDAQKFAAQVKRVETWDQIVEVARGHDLELVLMTYPVGYKDTNETVRMVAKKYDLILIDLEKVFLQLAVDNPSVRYIDDWEHCTAAGYAVIARLVRDVVVR